MNINYNDDFLNDLKQNQEHLSQKFNFLLGKNSKTKSITDSINEKKTFNDISHSELINESIKNKKNDSKKTKNIVKYAKKFDDPEITLSEILSLKEKRKRIIKTCKKFEKDNENLNDDENLNENKDRNTINKFKSHDTIEIKDGVIILNQEKKDDEKINPIQIEEKYINNNSNKLNKTKKSRSKWTDYENKKFYKALRYFGTEFSMISNLFENKNETQIKSKYNSEQKKNPLKIEKYLTTKKKVPTSFGEKLLDLEKYMKEKGKNMSLPEFNYDELFLGKKQSGISIDSIDKTINEHLLRNILEKSNSLKKEKESGKFDEE